MSSCLDKFEVKMMKNLLFALGVLLGYILAGGLIWAQLEADFYGFPFYSDRRLDGLSCPHLMTLQEQAEIRLELRNPGDTPLNQMVSVEISTPGPLFSEREVLSLLPGEEKVVAWPISARANRDLGFFIFARAYRYPTYLAPMAQATCGILVLPLPGRGDVLLWFWILLTGALILPRLWHMEDLSNGPQRLIFRLLALGLCLLLLVALWRWWPVGIFLLAVQLILIVVVLTHRWFVRP
jgi:hypothetical protein